MASEDPPNREAVEELKALVREGLLERLLLCASRRLSALTWLGEWRGAPPGAREAEDIVCDAVVKFLSGQRRRDPKQPLDTFLLQAVSSEISNLVRSADNTRVRRLDREDTLAAARGPGPEDQEQWETVLRRLEDPFLRELARLIGEENVSRRQALAQRTGKSPQEISNALKRLRRKLERIYPAGRRPDARTDPDESEGDRCR